MLNYLRIAREGSPDGGTTSIRFVHNNTSIIILKYLFYKRGYYEQSRTQRF